MDQGLHWHDREPMRPSPRTLASLAPTRATLVVVVVVPAPPGGHHARAVPSAGAAAADARARAALSATRRRAETLHCIHESRCGPHLAPMSTSRRGTSLRAPFPPPVPALPMRAPAPRCQRRASGRKHCIAFTNHDAALTSPPCPRPAGGPPCARRPIRRRRPCRCARPRQAISLWLGVPSSFKRN